MYAKDSYLPKRLNEVTRFQQYPTKMKFIDLRRRLMRMLQNEEVMKMLNDLEQNRFVGTDIQQEWHHAKMIMSLAKTARSMGLSANYDVRTATKDLMVMLGFVDPNKVVDAQPNLVEPERNVIRTWLFTL